MRILIFNIILIIFCSHAVAKQEQFNRSDTSKEINLSYAWKDHSNATRTLAFSFEKEKLKDQFKHSKAYRKEIAQRHVYVALQKEAQKVNPKEARVRLQKIANEIRISVRSDSSEQQQIWLNRLFQARETAFDNYLESNHYNRYISPTGQEGVKPDHVRFIRENVHVLLPVAQAIYEKLDEDSSTRAYVNLLLSWLQSIPYNPLEDRITSNGSGYLPPTEVITGNLGDCDSKTVLAASLMRSLLPQLSMVVIFVPGHAFMGANLPHREDERVLRLDGLDYLLLEPTGPALMSLGEVAESSQYYLDSGMYTYEKVP